MEISKSNDGRRPEPKLRPKWQIQVFLLCLLISAFVWLLVKLSKEYQSNVVIPVVFTNVPSGKVFSGATDSMLVLSIKSNGYNIIARKFFRGGRQLIVDLEGVKLEKQGQYHEGVLTEDEIANRLGEVLGRNEVLIAFSPATVAFRCENASFRKIPVKVKLNLDFADHHLLRGSVKCEPDSVTITGSPDKIAKITEIETESHTLRGLKEDKDINIPLNTASLNSKISFNTTYVKVRIPVAKYIDESMLVKIEPDSVLAKYSLKVAPSETRVSYQVAVQDAGKVKASMFRVEVVYSGKMLRRSTFSRLELRESPAFVRVTGIDPSRAEYTIIK